MVSYSRDYLDALERAEKLIARMRKIAINTKYSNLRANHKLTNLAHELYALIDDDLLYALELFDAPEDDREAREYYDDDG